MDSKSRTSVVFAACCALSAPASAHVGAEANASFWIGLMHPLSGLDHLLAMLAVGLWSALVARRGAAEWLGAPFAFVAMLPIGALLGLQGVAPAGVEPMIAASLLAIGLLAATRLHLPASAAAALVAVFGVFHGLAHGAELAHVSGATAALAGMMLANVLLQTIGLVVGRAWRRASVWLPRMAGMAVALSGSAMLLRSV